MKILTNKKCITLDGKIILDALNYSSKQTASNDHGC